MHLVNVSHVLHPPKHANGMEPLKTHVFADPVLLKLGICPDWRCRVGGNVIFCVSRVDLAGYHVLP